MWTTERVNDMAKVTLTFHMPDDVLHKLIPCVSIYAVIHTTEGITEVVNDSAADKGIVAEGTNAVLHAWTKDSEAE